jgi:hypothetical protein
MILNATILPKVTIHPRAGYIMSFSSSVAFESRQRALGQVPSLDDQESQIINIPSASSKLSSVPETEMLANEATPKPTPRHIPVLSKALNLSNSKSLFFSLPSALLAAELAPLLDFASSSVLARTCRRSNPFFQKPLTDARLQQLLDAAVHGDKAEVEKIIQSNLKLLYMRGTTTDYSGRTHANRTVLQLAYGAVDRTVAKTQGMVEMLEGYVSRMSGGSDEVTSQYHEQFPEGWQAIEEARNAADFSALNKILSVVTHATPVDCAEAHRFDDAIQELLKKPASELHDPAALKKIIQSLHKANSRIKFEAAFADLSNYLKQQDVIKNDSFEPQVLKAIYEFKNYLEPKVTCTTGKHFNLELLAEAARLYDVNYEGFGNDWDSPKNLLCWQKVFGYVQRFVPACDAQLIAQGLFSVFDSGEVAHRSLSFRGGSGSYFPLNLDPSISLGYSRAIRVGCWMAPAPAARGACADPDYPDLFKILSDKKHQFARPAVRGPEPARDHKSRCLVM